MLHYQTIIGSLSTTMARVQPKWKTAMNLSLFAKIRIAFLLVFFVSTSTQVQASLHAIDDASTMEIMYLASERLKAIDLQPALSNPTCAFLHKKAFMAHQDSHYRYLAVACDYADAVIETGRDETADNWIQVPYSEIFLEKVQELRDHLLSIHFDRVANPNPLSQQVDGLSEAGEFLISAQLGIIEASFAVLQHDERLADLFYWPISHHESSNHDR